MCPGSVFMSVLCVIVQFTSTLLPDLIEFNWVLLVLGEEKTMLRYDTKVPTEVMKQKVIMSI